MKRVNILWIDLISKVYDIQNHWIMKFQALMGAFIGLVIKIHLIPMQHGAGVVKL